MDPQILQAVCQKVYMRFPQLSGVQPKIQRQNIGATMQRYLLVFRSHGQAANGKLIPFDVRVVSDEEGKILKLTTSR